MGGQNILPALDLDGAEISNGGLYRYRLWRTWNRSLPRLLWVMLNPSDADAFADDPTVRKCMGFAQRWGHGSIEVVNLYAFRTPYPTILKAAIQDRVDAVGPGNDAAIVDAMTRAMTVVAAWGAKKFASERATKVRDLLRTHPNVVCLGRSIDGHPMHPLYLPYLTVPEIFA
jgi:hypothetical protein